MTDEFKRFSISHLVVLSALASGLLFPNLNRGGLSGYDDALYAHEGKEMLRGGNWWTVHFNGSPNYEYPPVFLWLEAASMKMFGVNDAAAKLPSALAGLGTILVLYLLAAEFTANVWLATIATFVLTTSQLFVKYATHAMTDTPFTFFATLALYLYVKGLRKPWCLAAAGLPIAIAILTRSVIGMFPLAVMVVHLIVTKRHRLLFSFEFLACWAMALGLPLVWFGFPPRPEHVAFLLGKMAGAGWRPSLHLLDYAWMLLRFYWPWLPFLFVGAALQVRSRIWLPLLWFILVVAPLSLVSVKYARYLIPVFPAMAIITAAGVNRFIPATRRGWFFAAGCCALLFVDVFTVSFPAKERGIDMRALAPIADRNTAASARVLLYSGGAAAYDVQNQLLWYSGRYTELTTEMERLQDAHERTLIIDRPSWALLGSRLGTRAKLLGESEKYVCVRVS